MSVHLYRCQCELGTIWNPPLRLAIRAYSERFPRVYLRIVDEDWVLRSLEVGLSGVGLLILLYLAEFLAPFHVVHLRTGEHSNVANFWEDGFWVAVFSANDGSLCYLSEYSGACFVNLRLSLGIVLAGGFEKINIEN